MRAVANPMQVMMSGFVNGGGSMPSNDSSPQSNAYYKFLLDYINEQEKRGYKEHYTNEWAKTAEQLYGNPDVQGGQGLLQDESLDPWSRRGLLMARAAGTSGNPLALESALKMAEASQESFARGGVPSEKMREYELAQRDDQFNQWLNAQRSVTVPAQIQINEEIGRLRAEGREAEAMRLEQMANPRSPEIITEAKTAETKAEQEPKLIIQRIDAFPAVDRSYQHVMDTTSRLKDTTGRIKSLIAENPTWTTGGMGTLLKYLPSTDAKLLQTELQSLRSGIAMQSLEELKRLSATGATGFGALSEGELRVVQDNVARLEQATTPEQLKDALDRLDASLSDTQARVKEGRVRDIQWMEKNKHYAPNLYEPPKPELTERPSVQQQFEANRGAVAGKPAAPAGGAGWGIRRKQ